MCNLNDQHNVINDCLSYDGDINNLFTGFFNVIGKNVTIGKGTTIGSHCIIGDNVVIGENVDVQNYVLLKKDTIIGDSCYVDSYFRSSGDNKIGNNVTLRFGSTIARKVYVSDGVFISPNVMTIFSTPSGDTNEGTYLEEGVFVGTASVLAPNITICKDTVIGGNSFVNKDITKTGIYAGVPAKFIKER
jgi:UDP-2-acetamido-3-amino-2,3-dideoxy-glucuronate N-acetyltransferase